MATKSFLKLFSESIVDYQKHFPLVFKIILFSYIIPLIFFNFLGSLFSGAISFLIFGFNETIIVSFLNLIVTIVIIKMLFLKKKKKNLSYIETIKSASEHFIEGIILFIIYMWALFGLFLFFVIPGIVFHIYWIFSFYALIIDDVGVTKALNHSNNVVRNRWWKVFFYYLIIEGITTIFSIILLIPYLLVNYVFNVNSLIIKSLFFYLGLGFSGFVFIPFTLIFMQKFYLDLKKYTKNIN
ncbi:hypothetical protein GF327_00495 [Candidatus Woesearchaeota archaeon]|nr:hypothetical protein [Candidatus Woesearchaeota archaeon]